MFDLVLEKLPDRIQSKIKISERYFYQGTPCWEWTAYIDPQGYGRVTFDGCSQSAHVLVYNILVGPVPTKLELDHLCRVTWCVRYNHLEAVTHAENIRRSPFFNLPDCINGHAYTEENTFINSVGYRECRICKKAWSMRYEIKKRGYKERPKITHCPYGHEYTEANTYIDPLMGTRNCKTCKRNRKQASREKKRGYKERPKITHCPYGHEYTEANTYIHPTTGTRNCRTCRRNGKEAYAEKKKRERDT
jgi:hypothetical protein